MGQGEKRRGKNEMEHLVGQPGDELVETPTPMFPELLPAVTAWYHSSSCCPIPQN